ncbi:hypothetical protein BDV93DRAFT_360914 [Ceratobasidium sp. AG-I]|nr:hypothetical protein BDV93DRAFT_360914 [Ceratobasidium sp. AG-I]
MKHAPGPIPSSCVTCRQRRKKCDRTHPVCTRCTTGGYKCLGYESVASSSGSTNLGAASSRSDVATAPHYTLHMPKVAPQRQQATHMPEEEPPLRVASDDLHASIFGIQEDHSRTNRRERQAVTQI